MERCRQNSIIPDPPRSPAEFRPPDGSSFQGDIREIPKEIATIPRRED